MSVPARRAVLWSLLVSGLLAVVVAAILGGGWAREGRAAPPPVLGEVPEFSLVNRDGRAVTRDDLAGAPWVVDFIFTRCAFTCPRMTSAMARLGARLGEGSPSARRVSISVDPEHDTPEVLASYAQGYGAPPGWLFLTGEREEIYRLVGGGFKLVVDASPPAELASEEEPILHSTRFVLVDGGGRIRGYYDGFDAGEIQRLLRDLAAVTRELPEPSE